MAGYIFKELRITGQNKKDAVITFKPGLNVISGPSDTGKTFIFDCIDYMLGSSKKLRNIPKLKGYTNIFLEIESNNQTYTIESKITNNNTYKLYHSKISKLNTEPEILKRKFVANSNNNISSFLLNLNEIGNKKIRKNDKGDTVNLSYRNVVKLALINEERIITKESPISSHYTKNTEESNILRFFLTGIDDSNIVKKISTEETQKRKGKIDLLNEFINNSQLDSNINIVEIDRQLEKIENSLNNFTQNFTRIKKEYLSLEKEYKDKNLVFLDFQKKYNELDELQKRSYILEQQYLSDISRLKSTIESGLFMSDTSISSCPTCKQEVEAEQLDVDQIISSCKSEIQKIKSLLIELKTSKKLIIAEHKEVQINISKITKEIEDVRIKLEEGVGSELDKTLETLSVLNNKKSQLIGMRDILKKRESFSQSIKELESSIPSGKTTYSSLTSDNLTKLCSKMTDILKDIGENKVVKYNKETFEFQIGDSFRGNYGKGYRAIYYAVYIIALHEIMEDKSYKIGVPVLDSPLVTYKSPKADGEGIKVNLALNFYRYLTTTNIEQTIIIENEEPPIDIHKNIHHIKFKGNGDGFIPK
ncbi:hypothetical protein [Myroides odoratus]|uniref:Chromosome segregation protein SMC n=1 Tax=Myroides odoratus TaxID=256 RepID=A0A378RNB7_MYROD|nr:hypothetical protein [Myroides odoratus]QQU04772.1 hypothetical protein I6I89_05640 [Myroides odoratus]STZ27781.1 chromosome segregation protein SMC [Myroides odoratus]